jgi:hypothetical protein
MEGFSYQHPERSGALEELDDLLDQLEKHLSVLEERLSPVVSQHATNARLMEPAPEPATALRGRNQRLRNSLGRLGQLTSEVDL